MKSAVATLLTFFASANTHMADSNDSASAKDEIPDVYKVDTKDYFDTLAREMFPDEEELESPSFREIPVFDLKYKNGKVKKFNASAVKPILGDPQVAWEVWQGAMSVRKQELGDKVGLDPTLLVPSAVESYRQALDASMKGRDAKKHVSDASRFMMASMDHMVDHMGMELPDEAKAVFMSNVAKFWDEQSSKLRSIGASEDAVLSTQATASMINNMSQRYMARDHIDKVEKGQEPSRFSQMNSEFADLITKIRKERDQEKKRDANEQLLKSFYIPSSEKKMSHSNKSSPHVKVQMVSDASKFKFPEVVDQRKIEADSVLQKDLMSQSAREAMMAVQAEETHRHTLATAKTFFINEALKKAAEAEAEEIVNEKMKFLKDQERKRLIESLKSSQNENQRLISTPEKDSDASERKRISSFKDFKVGRDFEIELPDMDSEMVQRGVFPVRSRETAAQMLRDAAQEAESHKNIAKTLRQTADVLEKQADLRMATEQLIATLDDVQQAFTGENTTGGAHQTSESEWFESMKDVAESRRPSSLVRNKSQNLDSLLSGAQLIDSTLPTRSNLRNSREKGTISKEAYEKYTENDDSQIAFLWKKAFEDFKDEGVLPDSYHFELEKFDSPSSAQEDKDFDPSEPDHPVVMSFLQRHAEDAYAIPSSFVSSDVQLVHIAPKSLKPPPKSQAADVSFKQQKKAKKENTIGGKFTIVQLPISDKDDKQKSEKKKSSFTQLQSQAVDVAEEKMQIIHELREADRHLQQEKTKEN